MIKFHKLRCNGVVNPECIDEVPVFSWSYAGNWERNAVQKAFTVELLTQDGELLFSQRSCKAQMQYACKAKLRPLTDYQWRVRTELSDGTVLVSQLQRFSTGLLGKPMGQYGAKWIGGSKKYESCAVSFRKSFFLTQPVKKASAYVFSSAWQRLSVNGRQLKEDCWLLPPNSSYAQRCIYEKYDLTDVLQQGSNELDILTGGGYNSHYSCFGWHLDCGKRIIGFVELSYADGTKAYIPTDDSWELYSSNITYCNIYNGEHYDGTLTPKKLEQARMKRSPVPKAKFWANEMPHIKAVKTVSPVQCTKKGNTCLFDMGENFAGIAKITLSAPRGTKITLQFSEMVYADGEQRTTTNREAEARDIYICSGEKQECFVPSFTYHGYRYVKVSGVSSAVKILDIVGIVLSSDVSSLSRFACSDAVVNKIHDNALRGLRSNLMSIPTDCPSRGERTPCAMDSLGTEVANFWNFDSQSYYRKWLGDINQGADTANDHGNPDWDGDKIILAHRLLKYCDDREIVKKYYPDMKACLAMFERNSADSLWYEGFGDWCHLNENTWESFHGSVMVVNTCLYYMVSCQMADIAQKLKKQADAEHFACLAGKIQKAFREKLLKADGIVNVGAHTEQVMALYANILPEGQVQPVLEKLLQKLGSEPMDLGIFGIMALAEVLPKYGHSDFLLKLLHNPEYPGYLYQIANGATSLWEVWSFDGPMASHNHAMFAGIEDAFYSGFAGLAPLTDGFAQFRVKPQLPAKISYVDCTAETVSGVIKLHCQQHAAGMELKLTVPVNTQAQVYLPDLGEDYVLYDGEVIQDRSGLPVEDGFIRLFLGSGNYCLRLVKEGLIAPNSVETQYLF